jgi:hypothetical protein
MFDKDNRYKQIPGERCVRGLLKVLIDINGNEFNADDYNRCFELTIDYPQENGKGVRVIDYIVCVDKSKGKFWNLIRRRQWMEDSDNHFYGKWIGGWE